MDGKTVDDPEGRGRKCTVTLYQAMWEMILKPVMTGQVWISPRYWSYEAGNLVFVLIFPVLLIGACCISFCKHVNAANRSSSYEENDGEKKGCMSFYNGPLPCLCNRSLK